MLCFQLLMCGCGFILFAPTTSLARHQHRKNETATPGKSNAAMIQARRDYETRCSSCHGLDGRGSERAPNISSDPAIVNLPDRDIFKMVHDGIPSKGMPAFGYLGGEEIKSLVSYLRAIGKPSGWKLESGNPLRGDEMFFGKAGCGTCHMVRGKGGFLGSDLTEYAATHTPEEAREAILDPGKLRDLHQEMVTIVTRAGARCSGVVRNEDNFSIQLMGVDGAFHNVVKSDVQDLKRSNTPVMPADYGQRLTGRELNDLVSFLAQAAQRRALPSKKPNRQSN